MPHHNQVRLIDFGLAKFREELSASTYHQSVAKVGSHGGTAAYMAPELDLEGLENTRNTDIYSFGTICWEVLTGKEPWKGMRSHVQRLTSINNGATLDYDLLPENVPLKVKELIQACLAYTPKPPSSGTGDSVSVSDSRSIRPRSSEALVVLREAYMALRNMSYDIFLRSVTLFPLL